MSIRTLAPLALLAAALLIPSGCKSTDNRDRGTSTAAPSEMEAAFYCDKCKTTFTRTPVNSGNPRAPYGVSAYRTVAEHECDDCRNVAAGMIQQGKTMKAGEIVHQCKICGGSMTVCHTS